MTNGWVIKPLAEVCEFQRGLTYTKSDEVDRPGRAVLRANNIDLASHSLDLEDLRFIATEVKVPDSKLVRRDSLLVCTASGSKSHLGKVAYIDEDYGYAFGGFMGQITPRPGVDGRFLFYTLTSPVYKAFIDDLSDGVNINNLKFDDLGRFPVPLPPLAEQRRIVAILDEVFNGIATAKANAEKSLQNARELFGRLLRAVFSPRSEGWVNKTVRQWVDDGVLAKPQDGNHGEIHPTKADYVDAGVPFIMAADLIDGVVDTESCRFIGRAQASALRIGFAKSGDVLLSHKGTIGRVAILDSDDDYVILTPQITYYRPLDGSRLFNGFLYYCLLNPTFQVALNSVADAGSTRAYIGITRQLDLEIALPPVEVQHRVATRLRNVDEALKRLADTYQAKLSALDELKKSVLHQAFTGQLSSSKQTKVAQQSALQTTTPEFSANVIALAHARHERKNREKTFGRVKEQKVLHLVESIAKVDLGRQPMKDAAGPNDFRHMLKAEEWAKDHKFFEMVKRGEGYEFRKLGRFDERLSSARQALAPCLQQLESVIDLLVPMDTVEAEVFATVHAAWNNLLIDGAAVADDAIVSAAREGWHADKLRIPEHKFRTAIASIRQKGLVPDGTAKYVSGQQSLL